MSDLPRPVGRPKGIPKTGGRQKGTRNRVSVIQAADIAASGETPLEYMMRIMRDPTVEHERRDRMAAAASPYVHPRLNAINHSGSIDLGLGDRLETALRRVEQPAEAEPTTH